MQTGTCFKNSSVVSSFIVCYFYELIINDKMDEDFNKNGISVTGNFF